MRSPDSGASSSIASCAAASWTDTMPSANPGSERTSAAGSTRNASGASASRWPLNPAACSTRELCRDVGPPRVDAQPERRVRIVRIENRLVLAWPVALDRGREPARMRGAGREVRIHFREHLDALALEAPQHGVDEARRTRVSQLARGTDGLRHGRMLRHFARHQLVEPDLEQGAQCRREPLGRPVRQLDQYRVQAVVPAQRAVGKRALEPASGAFVGVVGEQVLERAAPLGDLGYPPRRRRADPGGCSRGTAHSPNRVPASECACWNSAALMARRPASCRRSICSAPCPAATTSRVPVSITDPGAESIIRGSGVASQTRSCCPAQVVSATGRGLKARTWRSSAAASRVQSIAASPRSIFRA